eukprot:gene11423-4590_t
MTKERGFCSVMMAKVLEFIELILSVVFFILFMSYIVNEAILLKNEEKFTFPGNFVSLQNKENNINNINNNTLPETDSGMNDSDDVMVDEDDDYNVEQFERKNDLYAHLWCEGSLNSNFTIFIENDLGSNHVEEHSFLNFSFHQTEKYRICTYDRVGLGFSFSKTNSTLEEMMDNLNMLLRNSGERKPFLFLGRGFGSLLLLNYVQKYKENHIFGLILLDSLKQVNLTKEQINMNEWLSLFGSFRFKEYFGYFKKILGYGNYEKKIQYPDHHYTTNEQIQNNQINSNNYWKTLANEIKIFEEMKLKLNNLSQIFFENKIQFIHQSSSLIFLEFEKLFKQADSKNLQRELSQEELYGEIKKFIKK